MCDRPATPIARNQSRSDRTEDDRHAAGAEALDGEQDREDDERDRHDIGVEGGRHHLQAFDRREHRDRRRDDRVAEEQRRPAYADDEDRAAGARIGAAGKRHQRQRAALALVVGAQNEDHVFDGDDDRQRPDDQRQHAQNFHAHGRPAAGGGVQRLAKRIDRAGADVAIDDAERAEHQEPGPGSGRPSVPSGRSLQLRYRLVFGPSTLLRQSARGSTRPACLWQMLQCNSCLSPHAQFVAARPYQPQALRNRPTVPAMPYSSASAVRPWPIDTSARPGILRASAGRLATVRSWPALTASPAASAASAVLSQPFQFLGGSCRFGMAGTIRAGVEFDPVGAGVARRRNAIGIGDRKTARRGNRRVSAS